MKLSTIQATLAEHGLQPTRSLGQNFLHDQNLARWTVDQLDIQPDEAWVEIGPGLGSLTEFALERSPKGMLIEKDDRLIPYLKSRFPNLELIHGDATEFDVRELWRRGPTKVLGNLPYYVSSQILFNFTQDPSPVTGLVFTLQKELAERLAASPGTKDYGALTLLIGRRWKVKYLRTLPPSVFTPVPKVDSAVVVLTPRNPDELTACDGRRFEQLVKQGFSQRRKQLRKLISASVPDWSATVGKLGVPETVRAEELSLEQWIALTNLSVKAGASSHVPSVGEGAALESLAQDVHGEIFDVVDDTDRVIGTASRHEVHTRKLLHRAVHIFVFNRKGELFLQRRSRWKDMHPRRWDSSAAGHVNSGHDYDETASREIVEELGVETEVESLGEIRACEGTGWEFVRLYKARHEGPFILHPAEIETGEWFTLEQIDRWIAERPEDFATGFLECWQFFRSR
ncbi:16S rRNA (adenine(1518)-N(6)/adenine(1519)-N(6))-dimethyltransferase RsmA [Verrucomicrobiota bacterium sgz303538]